MRKYELNDIGVIQDSYFNKLHNLTPNFEKHKSWESLHWIQQHYPSWQYNGVAKFEEIMIWCEEHYGDWWVWYNETIYFNSEKDKMWFLLRWL